MFVPSELVIPKKLQKELPYKLKPKMGKIATEEEGRGSELVRRHTALILEPEESRVHSMMKLLRTVKEEKREKDTQQQKERWEKYKKVRRKAGQ